MERAATVPDSATVWAARQVVRQHTQPAAIVDARDPATGGRWPYPTHGTGHCAQCTADGCRMLVWAQAELAAAGLAQ